MRKHVAKIIILLALLAPANMSLAQQECSLEMGGYCVSYLMKETSWILLSHTGKDLEPMPRAELPAENQDSLLVGSSAFTYYETLWLKLTELKLVTEQERNLAFAEATQAGGIKIGGMNLVVLGARTLQKLVDMNIITLEQAQQILNGAKKHE